MSKRIKTTIITANFNNKQYFGEYLEGLYAQNEKPNLVCIVDDCSTDGFMDDAKRLSNIVDDGNILWQSNGIRFVISQNETNGGPGKARNKAIRLAQKYQPDTQVIGVCDSDDVYFKDKVKSSLDVYVKYNRTGIVYSDYSVKNEATGTITREYKEVFSLNKLMQECIVSNNSFFPLKLVESIGLYNESKGCISTEDYLLWQQLSTVSPSYHIPESLYLYRVHSRNLTVATPKEELCKRLNSCRQAYQEWRQKIG